MKKITDIFKHYQQEFSIRLNLHHDDQQKGGKEMEVFFGFALVLFTLVVGTAIGVRANKNVRAFNDDDHEIFVGRKNNK